MLYSKQNSPELSKWLGNKFKNSLLINVFSTKKNQFDGIQYQ